MPDDARSSLRKTDFVSTTTLMPKDLGIVCKCGHKFQVSLEDKHLRETIMAHPCCEEAPPMEDLKATIDLFSRYVEARSRLMGQGWDVDMSVPPWQC